MIECVRGAAFKIGRSRNVAHRLQNLQDATPHELRLIGTLAIAEKDAHHALKASRIRGEWFARTPHVVAFLVAHGLEVDR